MAVGKISRQVSFLIFAPAPGREMAKHSWGMPETSGARGRAGGGETPKKGIHKNLSKKHLSYFKEGEIDTLNLKLYPQVNLYFKKIVFRSFLKTFLVKR